MGKISHNLFLREWKFKPMRYILLLLLSCSFGLNTLEAQKKESRTGAQKLQMAEFFIDQLYVDSVDNNSLVEAAIRGMLSSLDPHSTYSTPEEVKAFEESMKGEFDGIGIQYRMLNDTLYVIRALDGGPSKAAGIRAGDQIIAVNDSSIVGSQITNKDITELLRGPRKSKVSLKIYRNHAPMTLLVERNKIPINTISAAYMLNPTTGYINLESFNTNSHKEFVSALKGLKQEGMQELILDVRGNSGGLLNIAVDIADEFLNAKERIVYAQGKRVDLGSFYATGSGKFKNGRLIILQDEFSASASEILSGAIQDWDRGLIIGRRSFGKGLVQRPIDLFDGSMMRLTIARYYTPSGRYIQKPYTKGADSQLQYRMEVLSRLDRGELVHPDSILVVDSLSYKTLVKGRSVYGGGGIMPDVFIPVDSVLLSPLFKGLSQPNALNSLFDYIHAQRSVILEAYPLEDFVDNYAVPVELIDQIRQTLLAGSKSTEVVDNKSRVDEFIATWLKSLIARDLYGDLAYFMVRNKSDQGVLKSLEVLGSGQYDLYLN